ncbi:hypothetical protein HDU88_006525 [Geranomyces variabilis]|nr:hypothetical protein HDU88_006525 [Geranomyces variabilis]
MGVFIRLPAPLHTWDEDVIEAALPNVEGVEHVIKKESPQHFAHIHFTSLYHAAMFFQQWGGRGIVINGKHCDVKPGQLNGQPVRYADPNTLVAPEMEAPALHKIGYFSTRRKDDVPNAVVSPVQRSHMWCNDDLYRLNETTPIYAQLVPVRTLHH